jgi:S1-C subfamily serine protease
MRNTSSKNSIALGWIAATLLMIGCVTLPKNMSQDWVPSVKPRLRAPIDAFVMVAIEYTAVPASCVTEDKDVDCAEILEELPIITAAGSGSGVLIESERGAVVLTAAHVCANDFPSTFEEEGSKVVIKIESTVDITLEAPTVGAFGATIIKMDEETDLCMLKPSKVFTHPVALSDVKPVIGDTIYSISAPFGISGIDLALIFEGFYSGTDIISGDRRVDFYTVPSRPGSSGGPIFNRSWEVVGMVHTAFSTLESVGIGAGLDPIRAFLFPGSVD